MREIAAHLSSGQDSLNRSSTFFNISFVKWYSKNRITLRYKQCLHFLEFFGMFLWLLNLPFWSLWHFDSHIILWSTTTNWLMTADQTCNEAGLFRLVFGPFENSNAVWLWMNQPTKRDWQPYGSVWGKLNLHKIIIHNFRSQSLNLFHCPY